MSATRDLLIEIGCEELPPTALHTLSKAFESNVNAAFKAAGLSFEIVTAYAAPRRLALMYTALIEQQPDKSVERRGPAIAAAFDDEGKPSRAAQGFAKSCGVEMESLGRLKTDKGEWLAFNAVEPGQKTAALVPDIIRQALDKLPIPKRMRWGALKTQFVRPVHWIVLLFGDEVIDTTILGIKSGRETRGHRFHHPEPISIVSPAHYEALLASPGMVIADFEKRQAKVAEQVMAEIVACGGNSDLALDEDLLNEVTGMVDWPVAVRGDFDKRFLNVPQEALISAMKGHQKYFHIVDNNNHLMPYFITLSNIESRDAAVVKHGNERVIRPRLSDSEFFWTQDQQQSLHDRLDSLGTVVFQNKLGSLKDKAIRVSQLSQQIAEQLGGNAGWAARAGLLAKCDLMTLMVGEFPDLQGVMGRYYAELDGEPAEVASAMDEQYRPRYAGDGLPDSTTGKAVAIADKIDTLVGIFGIGAIPTGDKDPFALRRAALGVLRIIIESELTLDLKHLLSAAVAAYNDQRKCVIADDVIDQVRGFMMDRLRVYFANKQVSPEVFESVLACQDSRPFDFNQRVLAVEAFCALPEADSLAAANKRISNILKKTDEAIPSSIDERLFQVDEERTLASAVSALEEQVHPMIEAGQYTQALTCLASLRESVDLFFDQVMVMVDDAAIRGNRLALLNSMRNLFLRVADLSKLQ